MEGKGTPDRRAVAATNQPGPTFAKAMVLGDEGTGKSALIQHLSANSTLPQNNRSSTPSFQDQDFFIQIELKAHEIEHNQPVILKIWEYSNTLSKKDEALAFRGALFTIILFDICSIQSYQAIRDHWLPLRDQLAPDSFLLIVGTRFESAHLRMVSLPEICKNAAKRDALYVELSNTNGQNVNLIRKVIAKRVQLMLQRREELLAHSNNNNSNAAGNNSIGLEESKQSGGKTEGGRQRGEGGGRSGSLLSPPELSLPYLEPQLMSDSVSSLLASFFNLDSWHCYDAQEQVLTAHAQRIAVLLQEFSSLSSSDQPQAGAAGAGAGGLGEELYLLPEVEQVDKALRGGEGEKGAEEEGEELRASLREIQEACRILHLSLPKTHLPSSTPSLYPLPSPPPSGPLSPEEYFSSLPPRPNLRKMRVRLPTGGLADMVLDLDAPLSPQIDLFLLSHSLAHDEESRGKLLLSVGKVQREYVEGGASRPRSASSRSTAQNNNYSSTAGGGGGHGGNSNSFPTQSNNNSVA